MAIYTWRHNLQWQAVAIIKKVHREIKRPSVPSRGERILFERKVKLLDPEEPYHSPFNPLEMIKVLLLLSHFSRVQLCVTPQTAAHQAPPSLGFSRQEHWSGLPFPSPMHESEKWKWSHSVMPNSSRPHGLRCSSRQITPFASRCFWGHQECLYFHHNLTVVGGSCGSVSIMTKLSSLPGILQTAIVCCHKCETGHIPLRLINFIRIPRLFTAGKDYFKNWLLN